MTKVEVTKEAIIEGLPGEPHHCAIAIAIGVALSSEEDISVYSGYEAYVGSKRVVIKDVDPQDLQRSVRSDISRFIDKYDNFGDGQAAWQSGEFEPFSFELED